MTDQQPGDSCSIGARRHGSTTSAGGTNYTGFTLDPGGHLRLLAGSTVTLPDGSQPANVLFSPARHLELE